jgi:hypothetical protein
MAQNLELEIADSAARTATTTFDCPDNYGFNGVTVFVEVTAISSTPSVTFAIQSQDPKSEAWHTLLVSAAVTGVSSNIYKVFPGATASANLIANDRLLRNWRIVATHADADSITYSIGAVLHK